jgi:hypothetical protein
MPAVLGLAVLGLAAAGLAGCGAAAPQSSHGYSSNGRTSIVQSSAESAPSAGVDDVQSPGAGPRAPQPTLAQRHAVSNRGAGSGNATSGAKAPEAKPPEVADEPSRGQLLIYSGALVLAIYEVEKTQDQAVALVEKMGGYVSQRTSKSLTARVPAKEFRPAMEQLGELGDVLNRSWQAQDVTDQVRDLDIRLKNALGLRDRLEALLDEVETIEEALKIETELERITLEIERIRSQLESFEDRIAYSTIQVSFRAKRTGEVPSEDFLLPFPWLDTLGLQSLLRSPGVYR